MSKFSRRQVMGGAGVAAVAGSTRGATAAVAAPNTAETLKADVCVVGAGFAGLSAALRLRDAGASVVLLEARDRVGGRSLSVSMKDGTFVDWGGQWVGPTQDRFYNLIKEMGCETYPSPNFGKTLQRSVLDAEKWYPIEHEGDDSYPGAAMVNAGYDAVDQLAATVDAEKPWEHPDAANLDSLTFAQWLRQNIENESVRKLVGVEVGSVPCANPEEISMLQLGWLIKACNGIEKLFGDEGGAQQDRLIGGTQTVAKKVAGKLGDVIKLGNPVRQIDWTANSVVVHSDKIKVDAKRVVVAVPPNLAGAIEYSPSLPADRVQVTQRWPQGLVIKVSMVYSEPFWRAAGLNGTSYDHLSVMGETADSSNPPEISKAGILTGFVYVDNARKLAPLPAEERKAILLGEIAKRFGPKALDTVNYHETHWSTQQWTRGCFTGFLTPGATTLFKTAVRDAVGPIHWAGTETSTVWPSFIDGAIRSGEREAAAVLAAMRG